jgi:hypothetical protein
VEWIPASAPIRSPRFPFTNVAGFSRSEAENHNSTNTRKNSVLDVFKRILEVADGL